MPPNGFCLPNSEWISCINYTSRPHSNECGPRTILGLAVMISHPSLNKQMLLPYMESNLAQCTPLWVSILLITGKTYLHQNSTNSTTTITSHQLTIPAVPHELLPWEAPTTVPNQWDQKPVGTLVSALKSPKRQPVHTGNPRPSPPTATKLDRVVYHPETKQLPRENDGTHKAYLEHTGVQLTIPHHLSEKAPTTSDIYQEVRGHHPAEIEHDKTLRIVFANPRGLKLFTDLLLTKHNLSTIASLGTGVLGLAETNLNWDHKHTKSILHSTVKNMWKHSISSHSHTADSFKTHKQPGGTLTLVCGNWTSRVIEHGQDPYRLGRWSFVVLHGKNDIRMLIVMAYRECTQTASSAGPKTLTSQQFHQLSCHFREANIMSDPIPRK